MGQFRPSDGRGRAVTARDSIERIRGAVPRQLLDLPVWLLWKQVNSPGKKPRKVPHWADGSPREGELDSAEDRARLVTFEEAARVFLRNVGYAGLGIALGEVPGEELHL